MRAADIDWTKLKIEYVTMGRSLKQLADKYHLQKTTISRRSKAEGWEAQRQQYVHDVYAKCAQRTQEVTGSAAERLAKSALKLMDKCDALLALDDVVAPRDLKAISDTLLSVKNLLGIKDEEEDKHELTVVWRDNPWDQH